MGSEPNPRRHRLAITVTFAFVARHALLVGPLCVLVAFARFAQTGYPALNAMVGTVLLEIVVEGGRVALGLLVIGRGSVVQGVRVIRDFFRLPEAERNARFAGTKKRLQAHWSSLTVDLAIYLVAALVLNLAIAAAAKDPLVIAMATSLGADPENATARVLLLKNVSVIPLTIIFQLLFFARIFLRSTENGPHQPPAS